MFRFRNRIEQAEGEVAKFRGELVDALLPGGEIDIEMVGDDFEGDVGLPEVFGDAVEGRGLHVEAVGTGGEVLQELGRIDVRGNETVGGKEFSIGGVRNLHGQVVEEHRVVEEGCAARHNPGDADNASHGRDVCAGGADVQDGELFVSVLLHEPEHGVCGVLAADAAKVHFLFDV